MGSPSKLLWVSQPSINHPIDTDHFLWTYGSQTNYCVVTIRPDYTIRTYLQKWYRDFMDGWEIQVYHAVLRYAAPTTDAHPSRFQRHWDKLSWRVNCNRQHLLHTDSNSGFSCRWGCLFTQIPDSWHCFRWKRSATAEWSALTQTVYSIHVSKDV